MKAPPKDASIPEATTETLKEYEAFLFGFPTRYGNQPGKMAVWTFAFDTILPIGYNRIAQVRAFWDATGQVKLLVSSS